MTTTDTATPAADALVSFPIVTVTPGAEGKLPAADAYVAGYLAEFVRQLAGSGTLDTRNLRAALAVAQAHDARVGGAR